MPYSLYYQSSIVGSRVALYGIPALSPNMGFGVRENSRRACCVCEAGQVSRYCLSLTVCSQLSFREHAETKEGIARAAIGSQKARNGPPLRPRRADVPVILLSLTSVVLRRARFHNVGLP